MGSDSIEKSNDGSYTYLWRRKRKAALSIAAAVATVVVLSFSSFFQSHGHKMSETEISTSDNRRGDGSGSGANTNTDTATTIVIAPGSRDRDGAGAGAGAGAVPQHGNSHSPIPPQCHNVLQKIMTCQKTSQETIIFGCHRKWCNSIQPLSHCEIVNGIGDRTKHMLSMFSDASLTKCLRVELDYPQEHNGIELRFGDDFEYKDKWGIVAEMLHFRSYDVSDLKVNVDEWGDFNKEQRQLGRQQKTSSSSLPSLREHSTKRKQTFVHFIPSHELYQFHKYDPCLYHILFKPTSKLETELQYYSDLMNIQDGNILGMHLRTGDLTAFGLHNKDIRTSASTLIDSYDAMMSCAEAHAAKLGIDNEKGSSDRKIKIFLATDNQIIKEKAKNDHRFKIFMTEDTPTAYVRSEGDRSAYTDLYLLSRTKGLVVNELPDKYDGPAEKVSTFAQLAMSIGFMEESQLHRCKLN